MTATDKPSTPAVSGAETVARRRAWLALLLLVPAPSLGAAAGMFWWPGTVLGKGIFLASKLWLVVFPVLWWRWVERGAWSWSPARKGGFGLAVASGLLISLAILAVYGLTRKLGWLDPALVVERSKQTGLNQPGLYLLGAVYWITLNSLMEEYVWRWFVFRQCERLAGGLGGVLLSALAFTLHHVLALSGQFSWGLTLLGSLGVFTGGAIWSALYLRCRSIWPCYVSHAIVDTPIFLIGWWLIFGSGGS